MSLQAREHHVSFLHASALPPLSLIYLPSLPSLLFPSPYPSVLILLTGLIQVSMDL